MLADQQLTTLAAAIAAETDAEFVAYRTNGQTPLMSDWFNRDASPAFIVWRDSVSTSEVGNAVNYVAVEAMTDANRGRITTFYVMNPDSFQPRADIRSYWANTFSGALGGEGANTRTALDALWRRNATRAEKLYATGTGTTASPANLVWTGTISDTDISRALTL